MAQARTVGDHFGALLEEQLNAAIQKKLDQTSSFKKSLAGIATVQDAQRKGFAPNDAQIAEMKERICHHANSKYAHAHFRGLAAHHAAKELVEEVAKDIASLNHKWKQNRQFCFDTAALGDLAKEAADLIAREHEHAKKLA